MALGSRMRIRWFGEKEEDQIRSRIRAGGGTDDLGSRRKINRWFGKQEKNLMVLGAGG